MLLAVLISDLLTLGLICDQSLTTTSYGTLKYLLSTMLERRNTENLQFPIYIPKNRELDPAEALNWEWVLIGMRGDRRLIKRRIIQNGGTGRGRLDLERGGSALTGSNRTLLYSRHSAQQPMGRGQETVQNSTQLARGGRGGRGGGRGRVATCISEVGMAQSTPTTIIPPPTPTTPSFMIPSGEEEEEELPEEIVQPQAVQAAMSVEDLPSDEEEEEEEEDETQTQETTTESETRGEPQKTKEDRKRTRQDSKSPPNQSQTKKKTAKC